MSTTVPTGLAEETEIKAYTDFVTGAPADVLSALGVGARQFGSARALAVREDPSRFFNRAGGSGLPSRSRRTSWSRCATSTALRACPRARS